MKSKFILILSILSYSVLFSQTTRFIYELKYKTDSTSNLYENENAIIEINTNDVQYYESKAIEIDSINNLRSNGVSAYPFPFAKLKRKLSDSKNENYYFFKNTYWKFESTDVMNWKVENETKTIDKWIAQKATTSFGGRIWTAWFINEIPISEGPYKFNGLPGLIVEVNDTKDNFNFKLVKIEKHKITNPEIVETVFKNRPLKISYKKYVEMLKAYYNDPYSEFRNMKEGTWKIGMTGSEITTIAGLNKLTKETQEYLRKNNNPIELDKGIKYK